MIGDDVRELLLTPHFVCNITKASVPTAEVRKPQSNPESKRFHKGLPEIVVECRAFLFFVTLGFFVTLSFS